jgi:hypothetical protein
MATHPHGPSCTPRQCWLLGVWLDFRLAGGCGVPYLLPTNSVCMCNVYSLFCGTIVATERGRSCRVVLEEKTAGND